MGDIKEVFDSGELYGVSGCVKKKKKEEKKKEQYRRMISFTASRKYPEPVFYKGKYPGFWHHDIV